MKSKEYVCQSCGYPTPSWFGKCPQCGGWNTFLERIPTSRPEKKPPSPSGKRPVSLEAISEKEMTSDTRFPSGISEVDRVLGGGIVEGSLSLLSGDPGIGKSTLLLAIAGGVARAGKKAVYISTEESLHQLFIRIQRLHFPRFPNLFVFSTDQFGDVESAVDTVHPDLMIVDSIQNLSIEEVESLPGSITLIRDLTLRCMEISKKRNVALFLVGHVTKEGTVAGPRTLEHLVDVVLYLDGEPQGPLRILRSVKNRFGSTQEVGLMEMKEEGLVELANPSQFFLNEENTSNSGTARTILAEGRRAILLEVQSLVNQSYLDFPRRVSVGMDVNRLHLLAAVVEKRLRVRFSHQDIYLNMTGGMKVTETVPDLAICFSLVSSRLEKPISKDTVYLGEVGLGGEIRPVYLFEMRIQEALRMGIQRVVTSHCHSKKRPRNLPSTLEIVGYDTLWNACQKEGLV